MPISISKHALQMFKSLFEAHFSSFENKAYAFQETIRKEQGLKSDIITEIPKLINDHSDPIELAEQMLTLVLDKFTNSIDRRQLKDIEALKENFPDKYKEFCLLLSEMLTSNGNEDDLFEALHKKIVCFHKSHSKTKVRATLFHLLLVALACKENSKTIFGTVTFFQLILTFFYDLNGFSMDDKDIVKNFTLVNKAVGILHNKMTNTWGWKPNDYTEVQSALWMILKNGKKVKNYCNAKKAVAESNKEIAKEFKEQVKNLPPLPEKYVESKRRIGQELLRKQLLGLYKNTCMLTEISNLELLRVSHIKPWKDCEDKSEKLDVNNCFLLSALWDLAFDSGLITFKDNGQLQLSSKLNESSKEYLRHQSPLVLNEEQRKYLSWHRMHVFQKTKKKSKAG